MKIVSIAVHEVSLRLRAPFTTSFGTYQDFKRPFIVIDTEDGLRGIGEVPTLTDPAYKPEADPPAVYTSLKAFILPSVSTHQAAHGAIDSVEELRKSYAWIKGAVFAKSGVEAALWDILAQRAGQPLWRMWGGERRSFAVGVSIGGQTIDQVMSRAEQAVEMGYSRLKVKIWPGFDVDVATALRRRFPDTLLQVDANSGYTLANWQALKGLDDLGLLLIEQPLHDDDLVLHSRISQELKTPVCLDESIHSLRDAQAAIILWEQNGALDRLIINIKPPRVSGFAEAIAIAGECRARGVKTWIGGMLDSAWGKAFNLNLNGLTAIDLPGDHFSPGGAYFQQDLTVAPLAVDSGVHTLTDGVSAGVAFDHEAFAHGGRMLFTRDFLCDADA